MEISHLLKTGKRLSGDCFSLVWEKSDSFKYGVFVSQKLGSAVRRNRLKRVFREAVRLNQKSLKGSVKVIILTRAASKDLSFESINAEISRLFKLIDTGA